MTQREINTYLERIYGYSLADWQPLFDLIPRIEQSTDFGKWVTKENQAPFFWETDVVSQFLELFYQMDLWFVFDWGQWRKGGKAIEDPKTDYYLFDLLTLLKFLTAIVRNDRFCEGYLGGRFSDGTILKILRALRQQLSYTSVDEVAGKTFGNDIFDWTRFSLYL